MEQKLTELNSMKEKGLITDEEYQAMRKKALGL
nr:SHOCT domain-containing protein [Synechococcus sp. MU1643]